MCIFVNIHLISRLLFLTFTTINKRSFNNIYNLLVHSILCSPRALHFDYSYLAVSSLYQHYIIR